MSSAPPTGPGADPRPDPLTAQRRRFDLLEAPFLVAGPDGRLRHATPAARLLGAAAEPGAPADALLPLPGDAGGSPVAAARRNGLWSGTGELPQGLWGRPMAVEITWVALSGPGDDGWCVGALRMWLPDASPAPVCEEERELATLRLIVRSTGHDLNNVLAPIPLSVGLLSEQGPDDSELLDNIEVSTREALVLIRQMHRAVEGRGEPAPRAPLGALVTGLRKAVGSSSLPLAALEVDLPRCQPDVGADPVELCQLLFNLGLAAFDAAGEGGLVRLTAPRLDAPEGPVLRLEIEGPGDPDGPDAYPAPLAEDPAEPRRLRTAACRLLAARLGVDLELAPRHAVIPLPPVAARREGHPTARSSSPPAR